MGILFARMDARRSMKEPPHSRWVARLRIGHNATSEVPMRPKKPRLASIAPLSLTSRAIVAPRGRIDHSARMHEALGAFRSECEAAIVTLRAALRDLAGSVQSDPLRPQEVSRRFGINKNLTWKFARVLLATDSFEAIGMIPGPEGVEIYLRALELGGAPPARAQAVRDALQRFDAVVVRHFGDRAQLEVVLDGLRSDGNLESSRRTAFKGMAGVFGVQARVRVTAQFLIPSAASKGHADIALVVDLAGIQRLRPMGALPIFRAGPSQGRENRVPQPFMRSDGVDQPDFLLRDFSSFPQATVNAKEAPGGRFVLELSEGPLGRMGESDLFFATVTREMINLRATADDRTCSLVTAVSIPAEAFASDLFVHRSIRVADTLRTSIHSTLSQPLSDDEQQRRASMLPIDTTPIVVDDLSKGFGVAGVPRYEEMILGAFESLHADPSEFQLIRVAMQFPPAPSALLVNWDLTE